MRVSGPPDHTDVVVQGYNQAGTFRCPEGWLTPSSCMNLSIAWTMSAGYGGCLTGGGIVLADRLIYCAGNKIVAVNIATGVSIWSYTTGSANLYATPVYDDGKVIICEDTTAITALDPATGAVLWTTTVGDAAVDTPFASARIWNGHVYVGISNKGGDNLGSRGKVVRLALADGSVETTWFAVGVGESGGGVWTTPLVDEDGAFYAVTGNPLSPDTLNTNCLLKVSTDFTTVLWRYQAIPGSDPDDFDFGTSPTLCRRAQGNLLVCGSKNGVVYAVNPTTGALVWFSQTGYGDPGEPSISSAAYDNQTDRLYITGMWPLSDGDLSKGGPTGYIACLDAATGGEQWHVPLAGTPIQQHPTLGTDVLLAIDGGARLLALDPATGAIIFTSGSLGAVAYVGPVVGRGRVFVFPFNGHVRCFVAPGSV